MLCKRDYGLDFLMSDEEEKKKRYLESLKKFSDISDDLIPTGRDDTVPLARIENAKWKQLVYSPLSVMQLCLPHKDPKSVSSWDVMNGESFVTLKAGNEKDEDGREVCSFLPYGWFPRYMLLWIQWHVQQTRSPKVFLGYNTADMLQHKLGLERQTSYYNNVSTHYGRLLHMDMQIKQLYSAIHLDARSPYQGEGEHIEYHRLAYKIDSFAQNKGSRQRGYVFYLSEPFFNTILEYPVPINMEHVRKLAKDGNTYNLDMYAFLCERLPRISADDPLFIERHEIEDLFGVNMTDRKKFYREMLLSKVVPAVKAVYPEADFTADKNGFTLRKSPPPLPQTKKIESAS